jgi:hypothetical protein
MNQDQLVEVYHDNKERHHVVHQQLVHHQNHQQNELYIRTKLYILLFFNLSIEHTFLKYVLK